MRVCGGVYGRGRIQLGRMLGCGEGRPMMRSIELMFVMVGDMMIKETFEVVKGAMLGMRRRYGRMGRGILSEGLRRSLGLWCSRHRWGGKEP
jgi:hypothetical protein